MKKQKLDKESHLFFELFSQLGRTQGYDTAFDDFLTIALTQFVHPDCSIGQQWHKNAISKYDQKEKEIIKELFGEMFISYKKNLQEDFSWFDLFGDTYMMIASKWKSSRMGQFFTPSNICDLMNMIQGMEGSGKRINDCACGSGRLLLSHHVRNPGNFYVGEDLDLICCKMTVLNFLLHGTVGEVWHHCSLSEPDTYRHRFVVNEMLNNGFPVPHVKIYANGILPFKRFETKPQTNISSSISEQLLLF